MSALLSKAEEADVEEEEEEVKPVERVSALSQQPARPQPSRPAFTEQQLKEHNERAFMLFDKAREAMKYHDGVKAIQDFAWDRLMEKVDLAVKQVQVLEVQVDEILKSVPSREDVASSGGTAFRPKSIAMYKQRLDYTGNVDAKGLPNGLGTATGVNEEGANVVYYGHFSAGQASGYGTFEESAPSYLIQVQGRFLNGKEQGPFVEKEIDRKSGQTTVSKGTFTFKQAGGLLKKTYSDGSVWTGPVDSVGNAQGEGLLQLPDGTALRGKLNDGVWSNTWARYGDGSSMLCFQLLFKDGLANCHSGYGRYNFKDGGYIVAMMDKAGKFAVPEIRYAPRDGQTLGYVREVTGIEGGVRIGRLTWEDGRTYQGQLGNGANLYGALGRMTYHQLGYFHVGRFDGRDMTDGIIYEPSGRQQSSVGAATRYEVPNVSSR